MKVFVDTAPIGEFDYGGRHPLRMERLALARFLIEAYGLLDGEGVLVLDPKQATEEDLRLFHEESYIEALRAAGAGEIPASGWGHGLGQGDNPVLPRLFDYILTYTGATLTAARAIVGGAEVAFNMSGGLHHAHANRASGFCYANDAVVAIQRLLEKYDRVMYVDVDAHHGDGVQWAFWKSNRVLTISFHETGRSLFPGTGFETEIGQGEGEGFSLNFPLQPGVDDEIFLSYFREITVEAYERFRPEVVVAQLGVDALEGDPLTHLTLTNGFLAGVVRFLHDLRMPLVALGGGGYDIDNVARAWTLAWAEMIGAEPPDRLPEEYLGARGTIRGGHCLRDPRRSGEVAGRPEAIAEAERIRRYLKAKVLPMIHP